MSWDDKYFFAARLIWFKTWNIQCGKFRRAAHISHRIFREYSGVCFLPLPTTQTIKVLFIKFWILLSTSNSPTTNCQTNKFHNTVCLWGRVCSDSQTDLRNASQINLSASWDVLTWAVSDFHFNTSHCIVLWRIVKELSYNQKYWLVYFNQNILLCCFSRFLPGHGGGGGLQAQYNHFYSMCGELSWLEVKTRRCFYHRLEGYNVAELAGWQPALITNTFTQIEIEWDLTAQQ